jgi:hypothetical protein
LSGPDDITPISADQFVRTNASRFFSSGHFTPQEAAGQLVVEALLSGARRVDVRQAGQWWLVRSDVDWLPPPIDEEAFRALVPFAEGGPNATRREILLAVFATDVVVVDGDAGLHVIKGYADAEIKASLACGDYARSVAFRE